MPLQKQPIAINFSQGLDTKTDPFQIPIGKFLTLTNTIFQKGLLLQKRNGFGALPALPVTTNALITTFNNNLTAVGSSLYAFASGSGTWTNRGKVSTVNLSTLPMVRSNATQTQVDTALGSNGLMCVVFTDAGASTTYRYGVLDATTGQYVVTPVAIPVSAGAIIGSPRVFALGNYFVIVITNLVSATNHLQYLSIGIDNPTVISAEVDISTQYTPATTVAFDGVVAGGSLYLAWNGSDGGGAIRMTYIDSQLNQHNTVTFASRLCTHMSVCADITQPSAVIYAAFYDSAGNDGYILAVSNILATVHAPSLWTSGVAISNVTVAAQSMVATIFWEIPNNYSYDAAVASHFLRSRTYTQAGALGTATTFVRSVGLASKAFIVSSTIYMLSLYSSPNQPTYFLIDSSGNVVTKLAYQNAGGYYILGLPSVNINGSTASVGYQFKDLLVPVNKTIAASQVNGFYSQLGLNYASINFAPSIILTSEIGGALNIAGGYLNSYDGFVPVENNFHLFPDSVEATWSATGGSIAAKPDGATNTNAYYYSVTYEWTDNQGNAHVSAPSIPIGVTTTGTGVIGSITVNVPTLRLTSKTVTALKIVLYRWSVSHQTFFQTSSITSPTYNDTTADSVAIVDTLADASIIGNSILYTTGGVVENIGPPAFDAVSIFKSRIFGIDSEDKNLLWYSKQVIEGVPVEMSDLFTIFVAPSISAQGSTGPMKCLAPMDDKFIIFKKNAVYYITGNGPDNTGLNNDFSDPVFITAVVGSSNQNSIVFMPQGLMFQSDKGIWLLGRDLSTNYIGAPVEAYNSATVLSAINVPGTNQVRFTLNNGVTLMYDYYYGQWGTFTNIPAISSTLYNSLHTYITSSGAVFQETVGQYLDNSNPTLIGFTTGWINIAGLQGFERAYYMWLLASYISPHKIAVSVAYDYNASAFQTTLISPNNFNTMWGGDQLWGDNSIWGGNPALEQWRVFFQKQKCEAIQITVQEIFDASKGVTAGAGFTMSGINLIIGAKLGYPQSGSSNNSVG